MFSRWCKSYLLNAFKIRVFKKGINQLVSPPVSNSWRTSVVRIVLHHDKKKKELHRDLCISKRKSRALFIFVVRNPYLIVPILSKSHTIFIYFGDNLSCRKKNGISHFQCNFPIGDNEPKHGESAICNPGIEGKEPA